LIKYILKKMGYAKADNYIHVAYESVSLPEGAFSGRAGTWIGYSADELLYEGVKRAVAEIDKRLEKSGIKNREKDKIAKQIANAAIKFSFLRMSHNRQVIFDWDRALNFEGDSGPYLQYACVRANKIIAKSEEAGIKAGITGDYQLNESEKRLIKKIQQFSSIIEKSARDFQSYYLAEYSLDLADAFNKFYESSPVIKAEKEEERKARLAIVSATAIVLKSALGLLGIEVPEKM
jgi:arginyl-tRNA synthetase